MSNETFLTIRGFLGADPTVFHNESSRATVVIRVGVTARNFDRKLNTYADGTTAWYSVRCYGELAENVARSVHKGSPVLVRGRLSPRMWTDKDGRVRIDYAIAADSVAIDLNTGWATFVRARQESLTPIEGEPTNTSEGEPLIAPPDSRSEEMPVEEESAQAMEASPGFLHAIAP